VVCRHHAGGVDTLVMTWESIQRGAKDVVNFSYWPSPFNFMKDARILLCNQDTWMAEFQFAFDLIAYFFWTQLIPSPRELERKAFTGSYRCGFYLDVNIKSPIEIVFGQGTSRMIGEIAAPFARGLFFWWAMGAAFEAAAIWQTLMFPELLCDPFIGDVARKNDTHVVPPNYIDGVPGLGEEIYDPHDWCAPFGPVVLLPPGGHRVYAAWLFNAGPTGMTNIQTGWQVAGVVQGIENHGDLLPGMQRPVIREIHQYSLASTEYAPWFSAVGGPSIVSGAAIVVRFLAYQNDEEAPFDGTDYGPPDPRDRDNPKCAQDFF